MFRPIPEAGQVPDDFGPLCTGRNDTRGLQLSEDEEIVELPWQILVVVVGDAANRHEVGVVRGGHGGHGAGLHIDCQRSCCFAEPFLVGGFQNHLLDSQNFSVVDAKTVVSDVQIPVTRQLMRGLPAHVVAVVAEEFKNFGADDDVTIAHRILKPAAKSRADDEAGTIAADGCLGGNAGAFLAYAQREQSHGLTAESAFVEIQVRLAHDIVGVCALEDRAQFLTDGDEDGDHGAAVGVKTVKEVKAVKK